MLVAFHRVATRQDQEMAELLGTLVAYTGRAA